jgi:hypothetical protein
MGGQTVVYGKPWNTPFRFMLVTMILCTLKSALFVLLNMESYAVSAFGIAMMFLWPLVLLIEVIFYWVVRRRIKERKFVWAHLIFSLFSFALLPLLYVGVIFITYMVVPANSVLKTIFLIQHYSYWGAAIIGHIFFVIVIFQCFSAKQPRQPNDDNDLLSEIAM